MFGKLLNLLNVTLTTTLSRAIPDIKPAAMSS